MNRDLDLSFLGVLKSIVYFVATAFTATLNFIEIETNVFLALAIAMALDTVTGIFKSRRLKIKISSKRGKKGVVDKVLMLISILSLGLIAKLLGINLSWLIINILIVLTIFEVYSVFGNILAMRTGKEEDEEDAVTLVIKVVRDFLKQKINKLLDSINK